MLNSVFKLIFLSFKLDRNQRRKLQRKSPKRSKRKKPILTLVTKVDQILIHMIPNQIILKKVQTKRNVKSDVKNQKRNIKRREISIPTPINTIMALYYSVFPQYGYFTQ